MRKALFLLWIVLVAAQLPAETLEKAYFFNHFQVKTIGEYSLIVAPGALNTAEAGKPLIPWFASNIVLSPGEEIESVEIEYLDKVQIPGYYQLMPKQYSQPISKGKTGDFVKDKAFYQSNAAYPGAGNHTQTTAFYAGHSVGMVNYTPFEYYPLSGELYYYRQVNLVIQTKQTPKAQEALLLYNSGNVVKNNLMQIADDTEKMKLYPSAPSAKNTDYDFLIITPSQFVPEFDTLVSHYLIRGLKAQIKSKEDILAEMDGQDAQDKIRNYIIQEYTNNNILYVMLGGDVEHIPYRGFYCHVQSSSVYEDDNIPSDLYYSALDGNWNTDADGRWAEIGEDDLLPEIAVARFSFSNSSELQKMLHKTISYQSAPVTGELAHPLFAGENLYDNPETWGSDYLELLVGYRDDNGYETTGIPESNNITKLYDEISGWSANTLTNEINAGKNFVHHVGHANENTVMKYYTSDITNSNFAGANGIDHQYTNVYTHGCICGSFDANDCIAEHMVKIDNFAAAFIGNSRYGWFNEGQTEGPSAHIHREFVNALYTDSAHRIGEAHRISKYETAPWVNAPGQWEEGALRWCFYDCNVLGDPAMSIWTAEPWDIDVNYPTAVTIGQPDYSLDITSSGNPVEGLTASLVMNGILYGTGISNANGEVLFNLDPVFTDVGTATLWVSGFNCTPHSFEVQVIPAEGAYVILQDFEINDENGNNNQALDYSESVTLSVALQNVGQVIAADVVAHLTCDNSQITISDNEVEAGQIQGNSTINMEDAFAFSVAGNVEDMTQIPFEVQITSGSNEWMSPLVITAFAPKFEMVAFDVNDESGNNNGRLDAGETVLFTVNFSNIGHSASQNISGQLSSQSGFVTISNPTQTANALAPSMESQLQFELVVNESAVIGDIAQLTFNLSSGAYGAYMAYFLPVGLQVEDWETGNFNQYEWYTGGNSPWTMTNTNPWEGEFCAQSGSIADYQSSEMLVDLNVINSDTLSFYYKVSSESDYDFLRFFVDENELDSWSGEVDWTRATYVVTAGEHTFTWAYTKDVSVTGGQDKAWVDYIVFPAMGIISQTNEMATMNMELYPNPVTHSASLQFVNEKPQVLSIMLVLPNGSTRALDSKMFASGLQNINLNFKDLSAGNYSLIITGKSGNSVVKFIKL